MPKTVAPEVIAERTQELVHKISRHVLSTEDPRAVFGFNLWFKNKYVNAYVRQGRRMDIERQRWVYTLEISSIEVKPQRRGYFTSFLNQMERLAQHRGLNVLVENVFEEGVRAFLLKRGYEEYNPQSGSWPPSYWRV